MGNAHLNAMPSALNPAMGPRDEPEDDGAVRASYPSDLAVLITLIPLNRVVAEPWLTAETWLGWPLPSKNDPNIR